jgi:5'(3')-deoxyribonucleotidase
LSDKPLVLLDVDGVCADIVRASIAAMKGCPVFRPSDVTSWDFSSVPGLDVQELYRRWSLPGFCSGIPVCKGAVEGVMELQRHADVVFCTTPFEPSKTWEYERAMWLERVFGASAEDIVFARDKASVEGDFLVDDRTKNLQQAECCGGKGAWFPVCWDAPYNRDWRGLRVKTWEGLAAVVKGWRGCVSEYSS